MVYAKHGTMDIQKAIEILENQNAWRRDNSGPPKTEQQSSSDIGKAIDVVLAEVNEHHKREKQLLAFLEAKQQEYGFNKNIEPDTANLIHAVLGDVINHISLSNDE